MIHRFHDFFTPEMIGFLLKILGGIVALVSGIVGLVGKDNYENGHLTWKGGMAFIGVILGSFITLASTVVDFHKDQSSAAEAKKKSALLMQSIQRGLYPMRGVQVDLAIQLSENAVKVTRFEDGFSTLNAEAQDCNHDFPKLVCLEFGSNPKIQQFEIGDTSDKYPQQGTRARTLLDSMGVLISLVHIERNGQQSAYQPIGRVAIGANAMTWHPVIRYTPHNPPGQRIVIEVSGVYIPNNALSNSHTYSLVDFLPGAIVVRSDFDKLSICNSLEDQQSCFNALSQSTLATFSMTFAFPASFTMNSSGYENALDCARGYQALLFKTDTEIDSLNKGGIVNLLNSNDNTEEKNKLCASVAQLNKVRVVYGRPNTSITEEK
jgi:hypothetical protein